MKKIYLCSPDALENKRLIRALQLELEERGAIITTNPNDSFETAITVAQEDDPILNELFKSEITVFFLCYEEDDIPDGAVAIIRPFSIEKFAEALFRSSSEGEKVTSNTRELIYKNGRLAYGSDEITLSDTEDKLFSILYENRGQPVSREIIKDKLWGIGDSNVVEVYISYLRKKLDQKYDKKFIVTVRNKGYMLI